jgi:hypothetical protein
MIASFALFLQALLPLSFLTGTSDAGAASADSPSWSMGSLCSAVHRATDADETPAPGGQAPGSHQSCPLCLGLHLAAAFLPPTTIAIVVPRERGLERRHRDVSVDRPDDRRSASRARAPPSLA